MPCERSQGILQGRKSIGKPSQKKSKEKEALLFYRDLLSILSPLTLNNHTKGNYKKNQSCHSFRSYNAEYLSFMNHVLDLANGNSGGGDSESPDDLTLLAQSHSVAKPSEKATAFVSALNQLIAETTTAYNQRMAASKKPAPAPEPTPDPTPGGDSESPDKI